MPSVQSLPEAMHEARGHVQLKGCRQEHPPGFFAHTTVHHSTMQNTGTLLNSVNKFGLQFKDSDINHSISWCIISSRSSYNSLHVSKRCTCNLCLRENFLIICQPDLLSLNKYDELVSSCRQRNKALLRNN